MTLYKNEVRALQITQFLSRYAEICKTKCNRILPLLMVEASNETIKFRQKARISGILRGEPRIELFQGAKYPADFISNIYIFIKATEAREIFNSPQFQ